MVGRASEEWHKSGSQKQQNIVIQSIHDTGISLPVDGSGDHDLNIKDFTPEELVVDDWARSEEEMGYGVTETENTEPLPTDTCNDTIEFRLLDEQLPGPSATILICFSFYPFFLILYTVQSDGDISHIPLGNGLFIHSGYATVESVLIPWAVKTSSRV